MYNENCYLIHEDDYLSHIEEKVKLYSFVRQLAFAVRALPDCPPNHAVKKIADDFDIRADALFKTWGIPRSYLCTGDADELCELMENELIEPEDAGYYTDDEDDEVFDYFDEDYDEDEDCDDDYCGEIDLHDIDELLRVTGDMTDAAGRLLKFISDMMPEKRAKRELDYGD